jgi:AraC-like DNA-binding protein
MQMAFLTDLLVRGATLGMCALVVVQLLSLRPLRFGALAGSLFVLTGAAYTLKNLPGGANLLGPAYLPLELASFLSVNFFLMFALALADDRYRPRWVELALGMLSTALFFLICIKPDHAYMVPARIAHVTVSLGFVGWAMRVTLANLRDDLVENRRGLSKAMLFIMPATGAIILVFTLIETVPSLGGTAPLLQSGVVFITIAAFAATISAVREDLFAGAPHPAAKPETALPPADRIELRRLQALMTNGIFLEPGLTIGAMAQKMDMPEHRLRRLINNHLGYRNFAAFINDHRIDEAKRRLANATLAREQITGLAFDLGFASLAPFNRAFRERVGMSPSEFRTHSLSALLEGADRHMPS